MLNKLSFSELGQAAYLFTHSMKADRGNLRLERQRKGGREWLMEKITPGCYSKEGSHLFSMWTLNIAWKIEMVVFLDSSSSATRMNGKGDSSLQRISGIQQHFDLSNFQAITLLSLLAFFFFSGVK